MGKFYAGIGSRKTPTAICTKMGVCAKHLANAGYTLRSGGAKGADVAFSSAIESTGLLQIYLPATRFNGFVHDGLNVLGPPKDDARKLAKKFHPNWSGLSDLGRDFMARNCYQVLGVDLETPVEFILCWTPGGKITGGTGQALRMAQEYEIPVVNFATETDDFISDFITSKGS